MFLQILSIKNIQSNTQETRIIIFRKSYVIHNYFIPTIMPHQLQHKDSTSIQNTVNISNTYDIHSCVTPRKHNTSVQTTYKPPRLTPLITTLPLLPSEQRKATHLHPLGKEYFCFQIDTKYPHAAHIYTPLFVSCRRNQRSLTTC